MFSQSFLAKFNSMMIDDRQYSIMLLLSIYHYNMYLLILFILLTSCLVKPFKIPYKSSVKYRVYLYKLKYKNLTVILI